PKAHPVAPAPASALLSGILTKSGVFGLIVICGRIMPGNAAFGNALLVLAAITMFVGAVLALLSVDLKRTLACSSMSQIGFITVGLSMMVLLGEEGSLASYGAVMHMVNHSLIKLCLFMAAGVVYMNLHKLNLNDIRGFGRGKPVLHISFLLGALSIGCIPPFGSGYNSKSLLHESILELVHHLEAHGHAAGGYRFLEILFIISGGLTIAYMTKLYICLFWQKHPTRQAEFDAKNKTYINVQSSVALLLSAVILPFLGFLPGLLMSPLGERSAAFFGQHPMEHAIHYFSGENLIGAGYSIAIGAFTYLCIVRPLLMKKENGIRVYVDRKPEWFDLENGVYRPVLLKLLPGILGGVVAIIGELPERLFLIGTKLVGALVSFVSAIPENIAFAMRGSVFSKKHEKKEAPAGNRFTFLLGRICNGVAHGLNKTVCRKNPVATDYEYRLAFWLDNAKQTADNSIGTISYGLLMMAIGLFVTCLYLVISR
ncbi:MAG: proton-conducting transporter membrane subunit, partial [Clostridia bacterium]|nr:proton-conducting transporter membrane subunit [Clostridia bacterium]